MRFGVLLPHFGEHASPDKIVRVTQRLERWGFDAVWARDHLIWEPHGMEGHDRTFLDPLLTLAAVAGATQRIGLGTAVLIPVRWPLKVAQEIASLSFLSGRRIDAGFGLGFSTQELAAAGFAYEDRKAIFTETIGICREVWTRDAVTWAGERFRFENVTLEPKPVAPVVTWYGGTTKASIRRAAQWCDGWLPGRIPMATLDDRLALIERAGEERGRPVRVGVIPIVKIERDRAKARAGIDVKGLAPSSEGSERWLAPAGGFQTIDDLEGLVIAGTPEECVTEIDKFRLRKVDDLILDLRLDFGRYEEQLQLIAEEVLPAFR